MRKDKGFTLIELLVVIAVIGLLSTIAVIALGNARKKANDAVRLSDIQQIQTALEFYYTEHNAYPSPHEKAALGIDTVSCLNSAGLQPRGCADAFMPQIPLDPQGKSYVYNAPTNDTYQLFSELEIGAGSFAKGQIVVTPAGIGQ